MKGMHFVESEPIQEQITRLTRAVETMGDQLHSIEQSQIRLETMFRHLWSQLAPGDHLEEHTLSSHEQAA